MAAFPVVMFVLLKGQTYLTVAGANIQTFTDETIYDGETYRNTVPAGYIGRAWDASVTAPFAVSGAPEGADENLLHTAPHPLEKTRTRIVWTTTGGDFCGECWADQYIGYSSAEPKFIAE